MSSWQVRLPDVTRAGSVKLGQRRYLISFNGTLAALAAGTTSAPQLMYKLRNTEAFELLAVGVIPDLAAGVSNLNTTELLWDTTQVPGHKWRTNNIGMNQLPYGLSENLAPMNWLGLPYRNKSTTPKFGANRRIQLRFTAEAGGAIVSPVRFRVVGILYKGTNALKGIYGSRTPLNKPLTEHSFEELSGGIKQGTVERRYHNEILNNADALVANVDADIHETRFDRNEFLEINSIGFADHPSNGIFNIWVDSARWPTEGTANIEPGSNEYPFGDDTHVGGAIKFPPDVRVRMINQRLRIPVKPTAAIAANALYGFYSGIYERH